MEDPFLTVPAIANELHVNEVTVRTWIRKGSLPRDPRRTDVSGQALRARSVGLDENRRWRS